MHEISVVEAGTRLSQLLDWVEAGEEVTITRFGKVVARLVAPVDVGKREQAVDIVAAVRAMRQGVTLNGIPIKSLIDEGRA